jgi:hypothetical protein
MALATTTDYLNFLKALLWILENEKGIDVGYLNQAGNPAYGNFENLLVRNGMTKADVDTVLSAYLTYKKTRRAAAASVYHPH